MLKGKVSSRNIQQLFVFHKILNYLNKGVYCPNFSPPPKISRPFLCLPLLHFFLVFLVYFILTIFFSHFSQLFLSPHLSACPSFRRFIRSVVTVRVSENWQLGVLFTTGICFESTCHGAYHYSRLEHLPTTVESLNTLS